jgi:hypothetical protein
MSGAEKYKKLSRLSLVKIALVIVSITAIVIGFIGLYNIYSNNKTDGLNNGEITVDNCAELDWSWRIYSCTGSYFSTGGGMVERENVTVKVFGGELKKGAVVGDVYPPSGQSAETTSYFITGRERASVTYNVPSLILVFFGIVFPVVTIVLFVVSRKKHSSG